MRVFSKYSGNRQITSPCTLAWSILGSSALLFSFQQSLNAQDTYLGPSILPPAPNAVDGGNPFQGLGRSDDPGPSREKQFGFPTYNTSGFNANGMQDSPPPVINSDSYANYRSTNSTNSGNGGGGSASSGANGQSGNGAPNNFPAGFIPTSMLDSPQIVPPSNIQAPAPQFKEQLNSVPNLPSGFAGQAGFGNVLPSDLQNSNGNSIRNINLESNFVNNVNTAAPTQTPIPPDSQQGGSASGISNFAISPQQNASTAAPQRSQSARSDQSDTNSKSSFFDSTASIFDKDVLPGTPDSSGASGATGASKPTGSSASSGDGVRGSSSKVGVPGSTNRNKSTSDNAFEDDNNTNNSKLVPPPPATPLSSTIGVPGGKVSSPLGTAVEQIKLGRLPDALTTINGVLRTDNQNANAHYLKAVVSVLSRRFTDARMEYLATLKFSHSAELSERARVGLTKLTR